jgi:hypothetical protein
MNRPTIYRLLLISLFTAFASQSSAVTDLSVGAAMPVLHGEYLNGKAAVMPEDAAGHVALLAFGFSYQARFTVEAWTKRFRGDFGNNPRVTFCEVPMIPNVARLTRWFIESGMRRGTPKADYRNVITVYGELNPWKQRLEVKDTDAAYLVVLDPKGNVAWVHSGKFTEADYQLLAAEIRKVLPTQ